MPLFCFPEVVDGWGAWHVCVRREEREGRRGFLDTGDGLYLDCLVVPEMAGYWALFRTGRRSRRRERLTRSDHGSIAWLFRHLSARDSVQSCTQAPRWIQSSVTGLVDDRSEADVKKYAVCLLTALTRFSCHHFYSDYFCI